jgi:hypothetical protein
MRKVIFLFICFVTFGVSPYGYANELTFNSKCIAAINGADFQEGRMSFMNGLQSLHNMASLMPEDPKTDQLLIPLWQGIALLNNINAVLSMRVLRTLVAPPKLSEADELITGHLNVLFNGFGVISKKLDASILISSNTGLREELREIRRSVNKMSASLNVCR